MCLKSLLERVKSTHDDAFLTHDDANNHAPYISPCQNTQWISWGPISETMEAAFPGWGSSTVALLTNWPAIIFVLTILPCCWAVQRYNLRVVTLTGGVFMIIGTALRCITSNTPTFTV